MGMFNSILADLVCPKTGLVDKDTEIQIKWQAHESLLLDVYRAGDFLPDLLSKHDNTWVRTDYICNECSPKETARDGTRFIRTKDQCRHIAFVEIRSGTIRRVLSEAEFRETGVDDYHDDVWTGAG